MFLNYKLTRKFDLYILDDIFYELQLESELHETLTVVNDFMKKSHELCTIITWPSLWREHIAIYSETGIDGVYIDLNKKDDSEKRHI